MLLGLTHTEKLSHTFRHTHTQRGHILRDKICQQQKTLTKTLTKKTFMQKHTLTRGLSVLHSSFTVKACYNACYCLWIHSVYVYYNYAAHLYTLTIDAPTKTHLTQRGEVSSCGDREILPAACCKLPSYFNMPGCPCVCVGSPALSMKADDPWESTYKVQCCF